MHTYPKKTLAGDGSDGMPVLICGRTRSVAACTIRRFALISETVLYFDQLNRIRQW
jgi:hypothetical protein